jgi:hypothetical protein
MLGLIDLQLGALHFSSICNPAVCSLKFLENAEMAGRSLWCILELVIHQMIILQKEYVYPLFPPFNTAFFVTICLIQNKITLKVFSLSYMLSF